MSWIGEYSTTETHTGVFFFVFYISFEKNKSELCKPLVSYQRGNKLQRGTLHQPHLIHKTTLHRHSLVTWGHLYLPQQLPHTCLVPEVGITMETFSPATGKRWLCGQQVESCLQRYQRAKDTQDEKGASASRTSSVLLSWQSPQSSLSLGPQYPPG